MPVGSCTATSADHLCQTSCAGFGVDNKKRNNVNQNYVFLLPGHPNSGHCTRCAQNQQAACRGVYIDAAYTAQSKSKYTPLYGGPFNASLNRYVSDVSG